MPTLFEKPQTRVKDNPRQSVGGKKMGPLTCFAVNPAGIRFETQQDDEEVLLFLRQHIVVNVPWVVLVVILLFIPFVFFPVISVELSKIVVLPAGYAIVGLLGWYLVTFGFAIAGFLRWFFNIYIVTNERIVDIDFVHLLYKQFSEARLINIQDITYKTGGIVETMFNIGNVFIQTASETPNFEFELVPNPEQIVKIISEASEEAKKRGI